MARLTKDDKKWITEKFGERANFRRTERILYSHDIAAIPSLFKPLIRGTVPDGIVQPQSEEELAELARWAAERKISLVPRGKGSSGYGGIIPAKNGLVVDFYRMKNVISIDEKKELVTIEPGITWEQLDHKLRPKGLVIRLYPTSYPSSSAGGWLAQGGAGIGSYEFGWFSENVVSARVVLPGGGVKEFSGQDLELISDAEGTTGLISQITLRVQKLTPVRMPTSWPGSFRILSTRTFPSGP